MTSTNGSRRSSDSPLLRGGRPDRPAPAQRQRPSRSRSPSRSSRSRSRNERTSRSRNRSQNGARAGAAGQQPSTRLATRPPNPRADRERRSRPNAGSRCRTRDQDGPRRRISESSGLTRQQSSQLAGWLRANTREGTVIAAPSDLRSVLEDRLGDRQVVAIEDDADPATDLVVLPRGWQPALPGLAVASLTTGTRTVDVLEPRRDAASVQAELARRVEAGGASWGPSNLRLTPRAWTMLANGLVDLSVASLLRSLLRTHTVEVSSFPRDRLATAAGAPARTVNITSLDGATPTAELIQTVRAPGARTHIGRDRAARPSSSFCRLPASARSPTIQGGLS